MGDTEPDAGEAKPNHDVVKAVAMVFLPFAAGYYLSYLYRSVNAVLSRPLTEDLGLPLGDIGLLTAVYFLAFASFQLPLGVLLDRFGPRRVQSVLLCVAAAGAGLFALSDGMAGLIAGRALIGFGVSGCLMASFKAITLWFPERRWPLVNGCFLAMGGLGAISATQPVELLLDETSWRLLFGGLAGTTLLVAVLIFLVVPERPLPGAGGRVRDQIAALRQIYGSALFWRTAPIVVASHGTSFALQGLWVGPFLREAGGLAPTEAAQTLLYMAMALTTGFVTMGLIADRLERLGVPLRAITCGGLVIFLIPQVFTVAGLDPTAIWPWLLFGFTSNATMLMYPFLSRRFPLGLAGRVNTGLNLMVFAGAFVLQYGVGQVIELWSPAEGGAHPLEAFQAGFGLLLALQLLAFVWFLTGMMARERPRQAAVSMQ